jgi:soluble P-type ATPase
VILAPEGQSQAKQEYVQRLGGERTVCIGNGRNDRLMMAAAAWASASCRPRAPRRRPSWQPM